jgi:hypothetical protein
MYIPTIGEALTLIKIIKETLPLLKHKDKERARKELQTAIRIATDAEIERYDTGRRNLHAKLKKSAPAKKRVTRSISSRRLKPVTLTKRK